LISRFVTSKPRALRLGSDKNRDIRVGVLPERKEILISGSCLAGFPVLDTGPGELEVSEHSDSAAPLDVNMLAKRVIRPALRNPKNYRDLEAKPLEWRGFYSLRRGIATQLTVMTRDSMVAEGLLRHFGLKTTLLHYIKDVPEVTANGMARIEQLFSKLDEKAIQ